MNNLGEVGSGSKAQLIDLQEARLWWLALVVIALLALTLYATDSIHSTSEWWFFPSVGLVLNTAWTRWTLLAATLIVCIYFRNSARNLRYENRELIRHLTEYSQQLHRKNQQISHLKGLSDQLLGITDLKEALRLVLEAMVEEMEPRTASVMLRDEVTDTYRIVAAYGLPQKIVETTRIKLGEAIAGRVVAEGEPMILDSDHLTLDMANRALRTDTIGSSMIVPIKLGDDVRGVVSVAKARGTGNFTDEDMAVLCSVASHASLIVQKADLLNSLHSKVETLAATIQELQQTRAELVQSEKLASIGRLAGGIAHEIRNPLQVILGRAELLEAREVDATKLRDLTAILDHTKRISEIIVSLLSFARQSDDTKFSGLDVNEAVRKTLHLVEPQVVPDGIEVKKNLQEELPRIVGNEGLLRQVFTNLALNAYQAMRDTGGGSLTITTRSSSAGVDVEFADTGPGIPPENLDRIFEPFFTTKPEGEGTGLGLSMAYGIVESHGGHIKVNNSPGQGAVFTVSLPTELKAA